MTRQAKELARQVSSYLSAVDGFSAAGSAPDYRPEASEIAERFETPERVSLRRRDIRAAGSKVRRGEWL